MPTNRKFGVEMEGYINTYPRDISIGGATVKQDGSLRNSHWGSTYSDSRGLHDYGVEVVTTPLRNLSTLDSIFEGMQNHNWHVDNHAGTHVHIDISDYSEYDKAKLLRFAKGIERIIFMFVKDYRSGNSYCKNLHEDWRKIFQPKIIKGKTGTQRINGRLRYVMVSEDRSETLDIERLTSRGKNLLEVLRDNGMSNCENNKYYWLNIYGSRHRTAEFRIFHAVENVVETKNFVKIALSIVDLCKHSSKEQLEFILLSLYEAKDTFVLRDNFLELLGLEGMNSCLHGINARHYLNEKLKGAYEKRVADAQAKLNLAEPIIIQSSLTIA